MKKNTDGLRSNSNKVCIKIKVQYTAFKEAGYNRVIFGKVPTKDMIVTKPGPKRCSKVCNDGIIFHKEATFFFKHNNRKIKKNSLEECPG